MWGLKEDDRDDRKKYHAPGVEWVKYTCCRPECGKVREILPSAYRTKLKNSKSGKLFCSVKCRGAQRTEDIEAKKRQDASVIAG